MDKGGRGVPRPHMGRQRQITLLTCLIGLLFTTNTCTATAKVVDEIIVTSDKNVMFYPAFADAITPVTTF